MTISRAALVSVAVLLGSVFGAKVSVAQQPQLPTEYNIKLLPAEIDLLGKALGTQPFNDVAPLVQKLRQQIVEQQQVVQPAPVPTPKPQEAK